MLARLFTPAPSLLRRRRNQPEPRRLAELELRPMVWRLTPLPLAWARTVFPFALTVVFIPLVAVVPLTAAPLLPPSA